MENYKKGKNIEEPLDRDKIQFPNLPKNFLWMQVRGGSKIRNLLSHALSEIHDVKYIVWTGFGQSVGKTITCVEIMKREMENTLHQITKICYRTVEEYWDPVLPQLDTLVVKRKLPMIHILLSSEQLDSNELGYQAPGVQIEYQKGDRKENIPKHKHNNNKNQKNRGNKKQRSNDNNGQKSNGKAEV